MAWIALIHIFRFGQALTGFAKQLYYGYFSDFVLPFGLYFLLSMSETQIPALGKWHAKAGIVLGACTFAEVCQYFDYPVLGVTFDPLDIAVYAAGVLAPVAVDQLILARCFKFWLSPVAK